MRLKKTHMAILNSASTNGLVRLPSNKFQAREAMATLRNLGYVEYTVKDGIAGNYRTEKPIECK